MACERKRYSSHLAALKSLSYYLREVVTDAEDLDIVFCDEHDGYHIVKYETERGDALVTG